MLNRSDSVSVREEFLKTAIFSLPTVTPILVREPRELAESRDVVLPSPSGAHGRLFGVKAFPGIRFEVIDHSIFQGVRVLLLWPVSRALGGWSKGSLPLVGARPRAGVVVSSTRWLLAFGVQSLVDFSRLLDEAAASRGCTR